MDLYSCEPMTLKRLVSGIPLFFTSDSRCPLSGTGQDYQSLLEAVKGYCEIFMQGVKNTVAMRFR